MVRTYHTLLFDRELFQSELNFMARNRSNTNTGAHHRLFSRASYQAIDSFFKIKIKMSVLPVEAVLQLSSDE